MSSSGQVLQRVHMGQQQQNNSNSSNCWGESKNYTCSSSSSSNCSRASNFYAKRQRQKCWRLWSWSWKSGWSYRAGVGAVASVAVGVLGLYQRSGSLNLQAVSFHFLTKPPNNNNNKLQHASGAQISSLQVAFLSAADTRTLMPPHGYGVCHKAQHSTAQLGAHSKKLAGHTGAQVDDCHRTFLRPFVPLFCRLSLARSQVYCVKI